MRKTSNVNLWDPLMYKYIHTHTCAYMHILYIKTPLIANKNYT